MDQLAVKLEKLYKTYPNASEEIITKVIDLWNPFRVHSYVSGEIKLSDEHLILANLDAAFKKKHIHLNWGLNIFRTQNILNLNLTKCNAGVKIAVSINKENRTFIYTFNGDINDLSLYDLIANLTENLFKSNYHDAVRNWLNNCIKQI